VIIKLQNYIDAINSGKIASGENIKLAIKRFENDLLRDDLIFDEDKVNDVINFISKLQHFSGQFAGKNFILENFQIFIIANIFGWNWKKNHQRRFTSSYITMARKNGKTSLLSAIALYNLICGTSDEQILLTANSREQAHIAFRITEKFVKKLDPTNKFLSVFKSEIQYARNDSFLKVLSSSHSTLDGYNVSFSLIDEFHEARDSKVRDVLRSGMIMRLNPHLCVITTAGFSMSSACYKLQESNIEILQGLKQDDSNFICIFSLDAKDDWKDEKNWIKSNPNLGITVNEEFLKNEIEGAIVNPANEIGVKTKNLNIWCETREIWIPNKYLMKATQKINLNDFKGEDAYLGMDLASNRDLVSFVILIVKDDKFYFYPKFYIPQESIEQRSDNYEYRNWINRKKLIVTPGNVTDYDRVVKDIEEINEITPIQKLYLDKYNATQISIMLGDMGYDVEFFSQTVGNFNSPTKDLERLILGGKVVLDDNEVLRWNFRNCNVTPDRMGNEKPKKPNKKDTKKIDGVIATIMSLAAYRKEGSESEFNLY